ncbi:MAG: alpha/beta fold hydrolase [Planctomycetota bacterium]
MSFTGHLEHFLVYYPFNREFTTHPAIEDVEFPTTDSLTLHGWFIPARNRPEDAGPAPTILHTHGNAGAIPEHVEFVQWLTAEGYNVFLFDYRDYGRSDNSPRLRNRNDFIADANAALDMLLDRGDVDPDRIALLGFSLGSTMGGVMASQRDEIAAVVLCAGFSSWKGVAGDYVPLLGPLLLRGGSDLKDAVTNYGDRPLLIAHGDADGIVKYRHAAIIEQAAKDAGVAVELYTEPGSDHNTLLLREGVRAEILRFLDRELSGPPPTQVTDPAR